MRLMLLLLPLLAGGCANKYLAERASRLELRVLTLETQLAQLRAELTLADATRPPTARAPAQPADTRRQRELALVGKPTAPIAVSRWFQGQHAYADSELTLLVFWEAWCPHCQREVPKLQSLHDRYGERGLTVVGLTKVSRSSTDDKVVAFLAQHKVTYPVGKELQSSMSLAFDVQGVPAAAVVKDGVIVWRGHPGYLQDAWFDDWLAE